MTPEVKPLTVDHEAAKRAVFWSRHWDKVEADAHKGESVRIARFIANRMAEEAARPRKSVPNPGIESEIVFDGGKFRRISDADCDTPIASMVHPAREAEQRRFAEAEADFMGVCKAETGMGVSPEEFERQKSERSEIRRQSHYLAHILENAGCKAYRDDAFQLWIWHVHSKVAEQIPNFRRICFLPYIAAIVRSTKLAALEYFLERNPFCRFWTFTSGQRVGIDGLRERIEYLHARLNALNKELRRRYGVEIVFRSTELGSVEIARADGSAADSGAIEYDENGKPLFHVHAHCVVSRYGGRLTKIEWTEMIHFVHEFWEHHWDAGKIIGNARECCKYVTKPGDMLALGERDPAALKAVEEALHGLRLVTPMGELKREIRTRKLAGKCLRRVRTREGMVWREAYDHNKHAAQDREDQEAMFRLHQAETMDRIDAKGLNGVEWPHEGSVRRKSDAPICRVMARLAPAVGPQGMKEPRVIVGGNLFDRRTVLNHPLVFRLWAETVEDWEAGRAIRVHTGTSTGETKPMEFLVDVPERMKPPAPPVWSEETLACAGTN